MTKKIDNRREAGDMNFLVGRLGSVPGLVKHCAGRISDLSAIRLADHSTSVRHAKSLAYLRHDLQQHLDALETAANLARKKADKLSQYMGFLRRQVQLAEKDAPKTSADNG